MQGLDTHICQANGLTGFLSMPCYLSAPKLECLDQYSQPLTYRCLGWKGGTLCIILGQHVDLFEYQSTGKI